MIIKSRPIGIIHSPFKTKEEAPIQPFKSDAEGRVEVYEKYAAGLEGIEQFSHVILAYYFHQIKDERLKVKPYLDDNEYGVYATRHPHRPNHIGISTVRLLGRKGKILRVKNIDIVDGSPLLDIKPYVSAFDRRDNVKDGWLEGKI
ncbi:MAG: tRNA (N6-threonylcarbamoyladenosine(37)-N6)-methyltransferase TrmO [Candidatus Saganbacteria bacterium]|nr:tRNA (N6-threonylcarbamoyladenosine(37)-N6)-methyltransferase TrmO [Candidatus Saganbacteria bacterium]